MDREAYVKALLSERARCVAEGKPESRVAAIDAVLERFDAAPKAAKPEKAIPPKAREK